MLYISALDKDLIKHQINTWIEIARREAYACATVEACYDGKIDHYFTKIFSEWADREISLLRSCNQDYAAGLLEGRLAGNRLYAGTFKEPAIR